LQSTARDFERTPVKGTTKDEMKLSLTEWKPQMTAQEVVVVKNLFLDKNVLKNPDPYTSCDSSLSSKRSST
jgi:hypothetical protein